MFKNPAHFNVNNRPTKLARGMTQTAYLRGHVGRLSIDACALSVRGTTDKLGAIRWYYIVGTESTCECCGQRLKLKALNDKGRRRLATIRRRRAA